MLPLPSSWRAAMLLLLAMLPRAIGALSEGKMITAEFDGEKATVPELRVEANTPLRRDWEKRYRAWAERVIAKPFIKDTAGKPWADPAAKFIGHSLDAWHIGGMSMEPLHADPDLAHPELAAEGKALLSADCRDPLVRFFAAYWAWLNSTSFHERSQLIRPDTGYALTDGRGAVERMETACNDLAATGFPKGALLFLAKDVEVGWDFEWYADRATPWVKNMVKWLPDALSEGSFNGEDGAIFAGLVNRRELGFRASASTAIDAVEKSALNDWAKLTVVAAWEIDAAWAARGTGYANTVKPEGWEGFNNNLKAAAVAIVKAWDTDPRHPEGAANMMKIMLANTDFAGAMNWFQKGIHAEFDYEKLYDTWFIFRLPRWGGRYAEILAIGRACAATHRYDTNVPEQFVNAMFAVMNDKKVNGAVIVPQTPWIADTLMEVTLGQLREPSRKNEGLKWRSLVVTRGWMAGKYDLAKKALAELPEGKLDVAAIEELQRNLFDPKFVLGELALTGTPAWKEFQAGETARIKGNFTEAMQHFTAALVATPQDGKGRDLIKYFVGSTSFNQELPRGEWTPVPLNAANWAVRSGDFKNDKDGALLVTCRPDRPSYLHFPGRVGLAYEIRGKFAATDPVSAPRLGIAVRGNYSFTDRYLVLQVTPKDNGKNLEGSLRDRFIALTENGHKPEAKKAEAKPENDFLIQVTPRSVRFVLNGTEVVPAFASKTFVGTADEARIGIVAPQGAAGVTRITSLEVRRLDEGE